ncbi:MAG: J domain-containing protein [Polyangiaceae bacterium]
MQLPGKLASSTLGDVLGTLLRARVTGLLRLIELGGERSGTPHAVHVVGGVPRAVLSDGPRLGEVLRRRGVIGKAAVYSALAEQRAREDGRLIGEVLCGLGSTSATVREAMREQTRERLDRLFAVRDAELSFHAALLPDLISPAILRAARTAPDLAPSEFLHGRARARARAIVRARAQREFDLAMLGLGEGAAPDEVRAAFRRKVATSHPDTAMTETERAARTRLLAGLSAAYHRLVKTS